MKTETLTVLPAGTADADGIRELERESFSDPWSSDSILSSLASPLSYVRLAVREGKTIGYLIASMVLDEGELLRVAVRPDCRLRGTGRLLIRTMLRENPGIRVWRLDVRESNYAARKLYESEGFCAVIRRRGYYEKPREDGIMMIRETPSDGIS